MHYIVNYNVFKEILKFLIKERTNYFQLIMIIDKQFINNLNNEKIVIFGKKLLYLHTQTLQIISFKNLHQHFSNPTNTLFLNQKFLIKKFKPFTTTPLFIYN